MQEVVAEGFQLSRQQKHLWLLQQADGSSAYRAQCGVLIEGALDPKILESAIEDVCERHEILRASFCCLPGMSIPLQVVTGHVRPAIKVYDLSEASSQEHQAKLDVLFNELWQSPIDLERGPLWHNFLAVLSPDRHVWVTALPAICADLCTLRNLVKEISRAYNEEILNDEVVQYIQFS